MFNTVLLVVVAVLLAGLILALLWLGAREAGGGTKLLVYFRTVFAALAIMSMLVTAYIVTVTRTAGGQPLPIDANVVAMFGALCSAGWIICGWLCGKSLGEKASGGDGIGGALKNIFTSSKPAGALEQKP